MSATPPAHIPPRPLRVGDTLHYTCSCTVELTEINTEINTMSFIIIKNCSLHTARNYTVDKLPTDAHNTPFVIVKSVSDDVDEYEALWKAFQKE